MADEIYELIVATFSSADGSAQALNTLREAERANPFKLYEAAIIQKEADQKIHIKETGDSTGTKGAAMGAVIGGAIGLIGGPLAVVTGAIGAAVGGLAAKLSDSGFPDHQLKEIGQHLNPGMSALVALVELAEPADLDDLLNELNASALKRSQINKALLEGAGSGVVGADRKDFLEMGAGATAVSLINEIARDERKAAGTESTSE